MKEIRYDTPIGDFHSFSDKPSIFLAGPTVRGHQPHLQPSWRFEAVEILKQIGFNGYVIIPEFKDLTLADKGQEDWIVPWENEGLSVSDAVLFWIPRTKELIGLTTNFEIGYWLGLEPHKVFYGRPNESYRNKYIDIMFKKVKGDEIYTDLKSLSERTVSEASQNFLELQEYNRMGFPFEL